MKILCRKIDLGYCLNNIVRKFFVLQDSGFGRLEGWIVLQGLRQAFGWTGSVTIQNLYRD